MNRENKPQKMNSEFDQLISQLSDDVILSLHAMGCVRGGAGEGGADIIMIPPPPGP